MTRRHGCLYLIAAPWLWCLGAAVYFCWPLAYLPGTVGVVFEAIWVPLALAVAVAARRRMRARRAVQEPPGLVQPRVRQPLDPVVRSSVWVRDGGRCRRCRISDSDCMALHGEHLQFDHVFPWSLGGSGEEDNIQLLCPPCNRAKGART